MFLKFILCNLFILGAYASPTQYNGQVTVYSKEEIQNSDFEASFEGKLEIALEEVKQAYTLLQDRIRANKGYFNSKRVKTILRDLKRVKINWDADATNHRFCTKNSLAYAIQALGRMAPNIYICPQLYLQEQDIITQVMLHEVAHFAAPGKECPASIFELYALQFSKIQNPIKSAYWKKCNLDKVLIKARKL